MKCTTRHAVALFGIYLFVVVSFIDLSAQTVRQATTLESVNQNRIFFHREEVVLLADVTTDGVLTWLVNQDESVRVLVFDVPQPPVGTRERLEVIGTFFDVGRLENNDARLVNLPIARISEELLQKPWPGVGELPLLVATSSRLVRDAANSLTLRSVVLSPHQFINEGVTISGRFRGRNLYGDMPKAPGESRWDFVLRSADAAAWIVGMEPKGDGFDLDVLARVDTNKWLEVTGTVRVNDGMVVIDAGRIDLASPSPDRPTEPAPALRPLPPPEVIFSTPLEEDINVAEDSTVRIQFSRDMDEDTFDGNVLVRYLTPTQDTAETASSPTFELAYRTRNRVLELTFHEKLERFRNVVVDLDNGITASDGSPLEPWSFSFFVTASP